MHLVGYLYEDYHDARSLEHKIPYGVINYLVGHSSFLITDVVQQHMVYELQRSTSVFKIKD